MVNIHSTNDEHLCLDHSIVTWMKVELWTDKRMASGRLADNIWHSFNACPLFRAHHQSHTSISNSTESTKRRRTIHGSARHRHTHTLCSVHWQRSPRSTSIDRAHVFIECKVASFFGWCRRLYALWFRICRHFWRTTVRGFSHLCDDIELHSLNSSERKRRNKTTFPHQINAQNVKSELEFLRIFYPHMTAANVELCRRHTRSSLVFFCLQLATTHFARSFDSNNLCEVHSASNLIVLTEEMDTD